MKIEVFMKRVLSFVLVAVIFISAFGTDAFAAMPETVEPMASAYISSYVASLATGTRKGEVVLTFYIDSPRMDLTKIGINNIVVYNENGTKVRSVGGTFDNGLLASGGRSYGASFSLILPTNVNYYMVVTFVAGNSTGVDTRNFTTNVAASHP